MECATLSIFPHGNAFWVAGGTLPSLAASSLQTELHVVIPSRAGRYVVVLRKQKQSLVLELLLPVLLLTHSSIPLQCSKDCTHILRKTKVGKENEILVHPASSFLLLERSVLLNGHALTRELHHQKHFHDPPFQSKMLKSHNTTSNRFRPAC